MWRVSIYAEIRRSLCKLLKWFEKLGWNQIKRDQTRPNQTNPDQTVLEGIRAVVEVQEECGRFGELSEFLDHPTFRVHKAKPLLLNRQRWHLGRFWFCIGNKNGCRVTAERKVDLWIYVELAKHPIGNITPTLLQTAFKLYDLIFQCIGYIWSHNWSGANFIELLSRENCLPGTFA